MPVHRILRCQPHPTPRTEALFSRQRTSRILGGLSTSSARLLRKGINLLPRVDAATHEMWEAGGLTNASPRINQLFADLMRGPLAVSEKHPSQGLDLLHRMGGGPVLGQLFLPQPRYYLSQEHADFVHDAFEQGSQSLDPSPVRTVARTVVSLLARAAGGMGKLRTLIRAQDNVGLRGALTRPMRLRQLNTLTSLESTSWLLD